MCPVFFRLGRADLGDALLGVLGVFAFMLLWRPAARKLGEDVPELTPVRVLYLLLAAVLTVALAVFLLNRFGPVDIKAYGTMLVLGLTAGTIWCIQEGSRRGHQPAIFIDFAIYMLLGGILGARVAYVALDWSAYSAHPKAVLALWEGGLSFHGGVAGAVLAALVFVRRYRKSFAELTDIAAPGLALGYAFGRLGCFLNGCCYGIPTTLPWGVSFPGATWQNGAPLSGPLHPTQIYGALASLLIFAILYLLRDRIARPGHLFLVYIALYSGYRFFLEELRYGVTGAPLPFFPDFTLGQAASALLILVAAATMLLTRPRRSAK